MARHGVTYLDVSNVAQQLVAGRTPTIETIRIALCTGSNSTLGTHLKTWKSKQDSTQQIATKENIPEELISALKGVWQRVMNQSEDMIQSIQQETQHELVQLKQEMLRLQKDNAHWQQQYHQTKQERDSFAHEKSAIEQLLANAKIEIAALTEKYVGLEQQNQEKQERINELYRQNQQVQANNDLAEIKQEKVIFQQQNQRAIFENDNLKMQLNKFETQHESMITRLNDSLSELAKKTQNQQHWQEQFQTLRAMHEEQNQSFVELNTKHALMLPKLEIIGAELNELRGQNKALAHEKWILGQEKAQLYGQLKQLECCLNL